jgi:hypothetical protein
VDVFRHVTRNARDPILRVCGPAEIRETPQRTGFDGVQRVIGHCVMSIGWRYQPRRTTTGDGASEDERLIGDPDRCLHAKSSPDTVDHRQGSAVLIGHPPDIRGTELGSSNGTRPTVYGRRRATVRAHPQACERAPLYGSLFVSHKQRLNVYLIRSVNS